MESLFTILKLICLVSLTTIVASMAIIVLLAAVYTIMDYAEEIIRDWKYNANMRSRRRLSSLDDERSNQG